MAQGTSWKKAEPWPPSRSPSCATFVMALIPQSPQKRRQPDPSRKGFSLLLSPPKPKPIPSRRTSEWMLPFLTSLLPYSPDSQMSLPASNSHLANRDSRLDGGFWGRKAAAYLGTFPPPGRRARHQGDCADRKTLKEQEVCTNVCDFVNTLAWTFQQ